MNALVNYDPQVPAYLRNDKMMAIAARLGGGLSSGAPPRISIKASRLRMISADGVETLSPENGGTTLDVVVLDANEAVSKFYYDHEYDPNAEGADAGPACFSEDGVAPAARSPRPQASRCASCPMNAWGSKISKFSGKKVKACGDVKKLAVIPASNLAGDAYMLGIPAASLTPWSALVSSTSKRGVPVTALTIRLGFNPKVSYPELTFTPVSFMTQEQFNLVSDLIDSPDMAQLVGRGEAHHAGPFALEQPAPSGVGYNQAQGSAGGGGGTGTGYQPLPPTNNPPNQFTPPPAQPAPAFLQPQPIGTQPIVPPQGFQLPQHSQQAVAATQPNPEGAPAPRRRGRPPGPAAAAPQAAQPAPAPIVVQQPVQTAAAQVIPAAQVAPTDAGMNALLDNIMGGGR